MHELESLALYEAGQRRQESATDARALSEELDYIEATAWQAGGWYDWKRPVYKRCGASETEEPEPEPFDWDGGFRTCYG